MVFCDCTSTLYSLFVATARKIDFQHHESLPLQLQSGKTKYFFQFIIKYFVRTSGTPSRKNPSKWKMQLKGDKSIGVRMPVSNKT